MGSNDVLFPLQSFDLDGGSQMILMGELAGTGVYFGRHSGVHEVVLAIGGQYPGPWTGHCTGHTLGQIFGHMGG